MVQVDYDFINKRGIHYNLLVPSSTSAPVPRNKGEYSGLNSHNFKANQPSPKVVWHKEVVGLLDVVVVVENRTASV